MPRLTSSWLLFATLLLVACGDDDGGPVDSGVADAEVPIDGAPPCESDEMCADGIYCNGDEVCSDGQCVFGRRRDCSDGVLCTVDTCSEGSQTCRNNAPDLDGDGHEDITCTDGNGDSLGDDCDDDNANRYPGNREVCDPMDVDEDCDDSTYGSLDNDGDGFDSDRCCNARATNPSQKTCGTDCKDQNSAIKPGAAEICDKLDNDCNDEVDEGATVMQYPDTDHDGHGDENAAGVPTCAGSVGFSAVNDDCNDNHRPDIHRAQVEICDTVDNDCDGATDEEENSVAWYEDNDGDGFGDSEQPAIASCVPPIGRVLLRTDCDDDNGEVNPGAAELCDAIDNDCSGTADFVIAVNDLEDDDGDGSADFACEPAGVDCDDNDPNTGNSIEICDGYDNDCDEKVDEDVPNTVWYLDRDGDGFGDTSAPAVVLCAPISGRTPFGGDCEDFSLDRTAEESAAVNPDAKEICNGRDDNCDGVIDNSPELLESGCIGQTATIAGTVFGPQGGTTVVRRGSASARPNQSQGTASLTRVDGAQITIVHHTGTIVGSTTTNANGTFSIRVPRGTVFVIVEPPTDLATDLVGSAIPVNGPRSDIEIFLHTPSNLADLMPTALADNGVIIANITGASPEGGQGIVIDPSVPTSATVGIAEQSGNTLPVYDQATWIPGGALPFATVSAIDVAPGGYLLTAIGSACTFTEGNYFGNSHIYVKSWPVRANVITWAPIDCSSGLGNCCDPHGGIGCTDSGINACITALDPGGCGSGQTSWDETCVHRVTSLGCSTCPAPSSCFGEHPSPGCDDSSIEACACDIELGDPACCDPQATWTSTCVGIAASCVGFAGL